MGLALRASAKASVNSCMGPAPVQKLVQILACAVRQHYTVPNLLVSSKNFHNFNHKKFSQTIFHLLGAPQHCIIFILDRQATELETTGTELSKNLLTMLIAEKFSLD